MAYMTPLNIILVTRRTNDNKLDFKKAPLKIPKDNVNEDENWGGRGYTTPLYAIEI